MESEGKGLTQMLMEEDPVQKNPSVPETEQLALEVGVILIEFPFDKLLHVYVTAPLALSIAELPRQTVLEGFAKIVSVGLGLTKIKPVLALSPTHPRELVPLTEYIILTEGVTTGDDPIIFPGCQVQVLAPNAVKVTVFPAQIIVGIPIANMVGVGATTTMTVPLMQPPPHT